MRRNITIHAIITFPLFLDENSAIFLKEYSNIFTAQL